MGVGQHHQIQPTDGLTAQHGNDDPLARVETTIDAAPPPSTRATNPRGPLDQDASPWPTSRKSLAARDRAAPDVSGGQRAAAPAPGKRPPRPAHRRRAGRPSNKF
jgi:hypothetical protein